MLDFSPFLLKELLIKALDGNYSYIVRYRQLQNVC